MKYFLLIFTLFMIQPLFANKTGHAVPSKVYFIEPKEGATVPAKFKVKMGVDGMKIHNAGEAIDNKTFGHHHLIVDGTSVKEGDAVPTDAQHIHFGKGQTETELELPAGDHTLTLQFADGAHRSYGDKLSSTIHIHVQ
jgi:hypothetical protein